MEETARTRMKYLGLVTSKGKPVFSVDYGDDGARRGENMERIRHYRRKALQHGYLPYAALSDRQLDELNEIPGVQP